MVRVDGKGGPDSLIKIRGLDKQYKRGGENIDVLQGLNLDVDKGDFVAFMGPSGSGKTTLLNLLGGLDVPTRGSITVAGDEVTHMSSGKLTEWRARHVGFIFQMYNLIPVLDAFRNARSTWRPRSVWSACRSESTITRGSSQAVRSSAWRSLARSLPIRPTYCVTNLPATWTARVRMKCWSFYTGCARNTAKRF
jgi:ABC-type Fe3+/spermidine/putrescine transport system ATPase subunit